ncbi:MAG TPA: NUDIX hydrolase [archaeon]|nr:NUDIX hydrolase [archaeon]
MPIKEIASCAIIKNSRLLVLWKKKYSHYKLPGGKLEEGETHEQAAVREAKEETGCSVRILKYTGYDDVKLSTAELRSHVFVAAIETGAPKLAEPDIFGEIIWIPLDSLGERKLAPHLRKFCDRYFHK